MELKTIRQVSLDYGISRQMLFYYEEIGLIKSSRKDDYAYRVYDEDAIKRLQQIIILRKLQIPMKQIKDVLNNQNASAVIDIFRQNISKLDEQITALSVVKSILTRLVDGLQEKADIHLKLDILNDKTMLVVSSLSFSENKINNVKGNVTMDELNKAHETLSKLKDNDVRIVYLPPMTVASFHCLASEGNEIRDYQANLHRIEKFVRETGLLKIKPDARLLDSFSSSKEGLKDVHDVKEILKDAHDVREIMEKAIESKSWASVPDVIRIILENKDFEAWVSIPDDMDVPAPLTKKTFEGGLYASRVLGRGIEKGVEDMLYFAEWINASEKYEFADDERPSFEETLNFYNFISNYADNAKRWDGYQTDWLFPIKRITE